MKIVALETIALRRRKKNGALGTIAFFREKENRRARKAVPAAQKKKISPMSKPIISIVDGVVRKPEWRMAEPVNFESLDGEHIAIVGPNASGKTRLAHVLTGRYPLLRTAPAYGFEARRGHTQSEGVKMLSFLDAYGGDADRTYFLQQRWNQAELADDTPTAAIRLEQAFERAYAGAEAEDVAAGRRLQSALYDAFALTPLLQTRMPSLSSGELRKVKITEALLAAPRVLIMDNPYIGLDAAMREQLTEVLATTAAHFGTQIILVLARAEDIPPFITHVVEVADCRIVRKVPREVFDAAQQTPKAEAQTPQLKAPSPEAEALPEDIRRSIEALPESAEEVGEEEVVGMRRVGIRYGERTILADLDWTVRRGEHWELRGSNGSGKSTLLSLVCADNPQSYACHMTLFGRRRGTGESIWSIKRRIGYVSPEMHRAYKRDLPAIQVVASGLSDSVGLYVRPRETDYAVCRFWLRAFGAEALESRPFLQLSSGEQRLVLLARAFVKDPDLLILDEPLHGLDNGGRMRAKAVINAFCSRQSKTLIMVSHYADEFPACIDHELELVRR